MRSLIVTVLMLAILGQSSALLAQPAQPGQAAAAQATADAGIKSPSQTFSYGVGHQIGSNLKASGFDIDLQLIMRGLADALAGRQNAVSDQQFQAAVGELRKQAAQKALERGKTFLAGNAKKPGVKTTKSGLQYIVLKAGTGATPTAQSTVSTHYRGRLLDGTVFDSSYQGEAPTAGDRTVSFPVGGVIKGWTEALQLMKTGGRWRLFIPSDLAYGERGAPPNIGPNETLIFDIELVETK